MGAKLGLSLSGGNRLRFSGNRMLRRIFGPKMEEDCGENCIMMNFMVCILHRILLA
jgi:hypothetical protein